MENEREIAIETQTHLNFPLINDMSGIALCNLYVPLTTMLSTKLKNKNRNKLSSYSLQILPIKNRNLPLAIGVKGTFHRCFLYGLRVNSAIYPLSSSNILIYFRTSSNLCFLVRNVDINDSLRI